MNVQVKPHRNRKAGGFNAAKDRATHSCSLATSILASLALLSGCDKLTPNGTSGTMSLLHSGSQQVCVASDVQKTLHDLILPTADDGDGSASPEDRLAAINTISVSFDLATLQGFDKAVSKASCNATAEISDTDGMSRKFDVDYQIVPSANDPSTFIITLGSNDAKTYAAMLVNAAAAAAATARQKQQEDAAAQQARAQLLATISPKWLVGTWIFADQAPASCADGSASTLSPAHVLTAKGVTARWALKDDQLHLVGNNLTGSFDNTFTITQADAVSLTTTSSSGETTAWRRCSSAEINVRPAEPSNEPDDGGDSTIIGPSPSDDAQ